LIFDLGTWVLAFLSWINFQDPRHKAEGLSNKAQDLIEDQVVARY